MLAQSPVHEVRKTVTVVFADITGSTALGERLDVESFRQVIGRYFDLARACLERHGRTVEKFIGDAVVAVFGVPAVHKDEAVRAVRAAAELRDSLASLNAELERDYDVALALRIGVNTGEVITDPGQIATGDAMNVARPRVAAERELRPAYEALERMQCWGYMTSVVPYLIDALLAQGRERECLALADFAAQKAVPEDMDAQAGWRRARAKLIARSGDHGGAELLPREAMAIVGRTDYLELRATVKKDVAEVLAIGGREKDA